jgi:hypothetical protein
VDEHRPVDRRDAAAELRAVGGVGDAAAGAVGLEQLRQHPGDACEDDRDRRGVVGAVGVQQHLGMAGGQLVAALAGGVVGVVAGDVPGGGLLLEPLAGVAKRDAGGGGDLGLGCGSEVVERLVEPEFQAQADAERLQRVGCVVDEPLGERFARVEVGVGCHGASRAPRWDPSRSR